jgi:hypothetical protein
MYENGKMRYIEIIPGIGGMGDKGEGWGDKFNYDIRTFVNVTMYPQIQQKYN